jgi:hypothetical protein
MLDPRRTIAELKELRALTCQASELAADHVLQVPRIILRPVEPGDLPLFFEHQRDPIAVAMVAFQSRDRAAFDQHWAKILADKTA